MTEVNQQLALVIQKSEEQNATTQGFLDEVDARIIAKENEVDVFLAATPQLAKVYYVNSDPAVGDDAFLGTEAAPFKSLVKAFSSVPYGAHGTINLLNDYELSSDASSPSYSNKNIILDLKGFVLSKTNTAISIENYSSLLNSFSVSNGTLRLDSSTLNGGNMFKVYDSSSFFELGNFYRPLIIESDEAIVSCARGNLFGTSNQVTASIINAVAGYKLFANASGGIIHDVVNSTTVLSSGITLN